MIYLNLLQIFSLFQLNNAIFFFFTIITLTTFYPFSSLLRRRVGNRQGGVGEEVAKLAAEIWRRLFPLRSGKRRLLFYSSGSAASRRFSRMDCACAVNPFRLCSALRVLGSFMVLLFLAIVALSYYAVVVVAWGPRLFHSFPLSLLASAIIVVFHLLVLRSNSSYPFSPVLPFRINM